MRVALLIAVALGTSCASLEPVGDAALRAATHEQTWIPLVGAVALSPGDWDEEISDWARDEQPLFRSTTGAENASDVFLGLLGLGTAATLPWAPWHELPLGAHPDDDFVLLAGPLVTLGATAWMKSTVGRERPNGEDTRSFPSGHSSLAFSFATATHHNLDHVPGSAVPWARGLNWGLAAGTAWARVEAGKHYLSDVLAGAALGHFFTRFLHELFPNDGSGFSVAMVDGSVEVGWAWRPMR